MVSFNQALRTWLASWRVAKRQSGSTGICPTWLLNCQLCLCSVSAAACSGSVLPALTSTLLAPLGPAWSSEGTWANLLLPSLFATRAQSWIGHFLSLLQWMYDRGLGLSGRQSGHQLELTHLSPWHTNPTRDFAKLFLCMKAHHLSSAYVITTLISAKWTNWRFICTTRACFNHQASL